MHVLGLGQGERKKESVKKNTYLVDTPTYLIDRIAPKPNPPFEKKRELNTKHSKTQTIYFIDR